MAEVGGIVLLAVVAIIWVILICDYWKTVHKWLEEEKDLENNKSKKEEL